MSKIPTKADVETILEGIYEQWPSVPNGWLNTIRARIAHLEQEVEKLQKAINEGYAYKYMTDDSPTLFTLIREATDEG